MRLAWQRQRAADRMQASGAASVAEQPLLALFRRRITAFAAVLRGHGLRFGAGEVVEAVSAMDAVGALDREDCFWALHCVFVQRREDSPRFAAAFQQFWRASMAEALLPPRVESVSALGEQSPEAAPGPAMEEPAAIPGRTQAATLARPDSGNSAGLDPETTSRAFYSMHESLASTDIAQMSATELDTAREAAQRLARTLRLIPTRRHRPDPAGGVIDRRGTLRTALRTGGDALVLRRRSVRRVPRPVVVLCDVSGSMAPYVTVLLHFFHALSQCHDVRTFLFGTQLSNVTRLLRTRDPQRALERIQHHTQGWGGGTRIGDSVAGFRRHWSRRMAASEAEVLLISDGLDLGPGEPLEQEMARLARASHRIIWLNPLLKFSAYAPLAAGARAIARHADEIRPIHDLASIEALVQGLAPMRRERWPSFASGVGPISTAPIHATSRQCVSLSPGEKP